MLDTMFSCDDNCEDVIIVAVVAVVVVVVVVGAKLNKLDVVWVVLLLVFVKSGVIKVLLEDDCSCGFEEKGLVIVVIGSVSWSYGI